MAARTSRKVAYKSKIGEHVTCFGSGAGTQPDRQDTYAQRRLARLYPPRERDRSAVRDRKRYDRSHRLAQRCRAEAPASL